MNFWQGEHVRLRGVEPSDATAFFEWNLDSEAARNLEFVWPPVSQAQVRSWVEEQSRKKLENDASIALHEKLGFVREGTLRRMVYTDRKYCDAHWYGMTKEEWEQSSLSVKGADL